MSLLGISWQLSLAWASLFQNVFRPKTYFSFLLKNIAILCLVQYRSGFVTLHWHNEEPQKFTRISIFYIINYYDIIKLAFYSYGQGKTL